MGLTRDELTPGVFIMTYPVSNFPERWIQRFNRSLLRISVNTGRGIRESSHIPMKLLNQKLPLLMWSWTSGSHGEGFYSRAVPRSCIFSLRFLYLWATPGPIALQYPERWYSSVIELLTMRTWVCTTDHLYLPASEGVALIPQLCVTLRTFTWPDLTCVYTESQQISFNYLDSAPWKLRERYAIMKSLGACSRPSRISSI